MKREASPARPDLAREAESIGFAWRFEDGEPYWDESVRYVFTLDEIERDLEAPAAELHALCLELVDQVVRDERRLARLAIPEHAWAPIAASWRRRDPSLYGRFDFAYDGSGAAKLLEYNADTPTSLFEAAVVQWRWLEALIATGELPPGSDQFNSLHEALIARWSEIADGRFIHFACLMRETDDRGTLAYLEDCARQANLKTLALDMGDIGLKDTRFVDRRGREIRHLFKLYPWEWMFADSFGPSVASTRTRFIEPPWKLILSNKGALAMLWELAPRHPNLLPCFFEDDRQTASLSRYARKPLYSREGADIALHGDGPPLLGASDGYGAEGWVRQELCPLPNFGGRYPVLGVWMAGDRPVGLGVREDATPLTSNRARFVPHCVRDPDLQPRQSFSLGLT